MSDPLTALMYAVQVMNFLKTLIIKTLKEREDSLVESIPVSRLEPSDENGHQSSSDLYPVDTKDLAEEFDGEEKVFVSSEPSLESPPHATWPHSMTGTSFHSFLASIENIIPAGTLSLADSCPCDVISQVNSLTNGLQEDGFAGSRRMDSQTNISKIKTGLSSSSSLKKGTKKLNEQSVASAAGPVEKSKGAGIVGLINSRTELFEAWR